MASPTTVDHVERVEQPAPSSAGVPTRHLLSPGTATYPGLSWQHSRNGIALIAVGLLLMLPAPRQSGPTYGRLDPAND